MYAWTFSLVRHSQHMFVHTRYLRRRQQGMISRDGMESKPIFANLYSLLLVSLLSSYLLSLYNSSGFWIVSYKQMASTLPLFTISCQSHPALYLSLTCLTSYAAHPHHISHHLNPVLEQLSSPANIIPPQTRVASNGDYTGRNNMYILKPTAIRCLHLSSWKQKTSKKESQLSTLALKKLKSK